MQRNIKFYLNYEECKCYAGITQRSPLLSFILTMRNVNDCIKGIAIEERKFYLNYEECKYKYLLIYSKFFVSFILTMRNVNSTLMLSVLLYDKVLS